MEEPGSAGTKMFQTGPGFGEGGILLFRPGAVWADGGFLAGQVGVGAPLQLGFKVVLSGPVGGMGKEGAVYVDRAILVDLGIADQDLEGRSLRRDPGSGPVAAHRAGPPVAQIPGDLHDGSEQHPAGKGMGGHSPIGVKGGFLVLSGRALDVQRSASGEGPVQKDFPLTVPEGCFGPMETWTPAVF